MAYEEELKHGRLAAEAAAYRTGPRGGKGNGGKTETGKGAR